MAEKGVFVDNGSGQKYYVPPSKKSQYNRNYWKKNKAKLKVKMRRRHRERQKVNKKMEVLKSGNFEGIGTLLQINGKHTYGYPVRVLARYVNRRPDSVRDWWDRGILPDTGLRTENNYRLFLFEHIRIVREVLDIYGVLKPSSARFPDGLKEEIHRKFNDLHKKINEGNYEFEVFNAKNF